MFEAVVLKPSILIVALSAAFSSSVLAAPVFWSGGSSFWDIVNNWGPLPVLPGAGDIVTIDSVGIQTITHRSGSNVIGSLLMPGDDVLALTGGSLTVNSTFANSGATNISGGTFALNGASSASTVQLNGQFTTLSGVGDLQVTSGGVFAWTGNSTQSGTGSTTIANGATMNVTGAANLSQRTINNNGTVVVTGALTNSGTINNSVGKTFNFLDGGTFTQFSAGSLNNAGLVTKTGIGTSTIFGAFNNSGTVNAQSGTLLLSGGGLMNGGTYTTSGSGALQLSGGTHTVNTNATINSTAVQLTGQFTTLNGSGELQVADGAVFAWTGNSTQSGTGSTTIANGATMNVTGAANLSQRTINNNGTVVVTGALTNSGTINNSVGKTFNFLDGGTFTQFSAGSLNNAGLVTKTGIGTSTIFGAFNNPGTVNALSGTLTVNPSFTNNGTVNVTAGAQFIAAGSIFINAGSINGNGTVVTPSSGLINQGSVNPGFGIGQLTVSGRLEETPSGILNFDLASLISFDLLTVLGNATLGGIIAVWGAGYVPVVGDSFTVMTFNDRAGTTFAGPVSVNGFGFGTAFNVVYDVNNVKLVVAAIPEPGILTMLLAGLGIVGGLAARRRRAAER